MCFLQLVSVLTVHSSLKHGYENKEKWHHYYTPDSCLFPRVCFNILIKGDVSLMALFLMCAQRCVCCCIYLKKHYMVQHFFPVQVFIESSESLDRHVTYTDSQLWKLLDRHANTIRLYVSLPEQAPGSQLRRALYQKSAGAAGNLEEPCERVKGPVGNMKSVEAILEESTEKLKSLSLQQQQQQEGDNGDSSKSTEASDFENIESPLNEIDSSASAENRELDNQIQISDPENLQSEERSDSDVNNDRSTSSVDSDILSSSHSSDTLCNVDNAPLPLANGLDSHSITSSRRSKANQGKKETWDTAEEDSGTDSEYDESGKSRGEAQYMYFKSEPYTAEEGSGEGQKCMYSFLSALK